MAGLNLKGNTWIPSTAYLEVMKIQEPAAATRISGEFVFKNKEECSVSINGSSYTTIEAGQGIVFKEGGVTSFIIKEANINFYFRYTYN